MPPWVLIASLTVCLAVSIFLLLVLPWGLEEDASHDRARADADPEDEAELVTLDTPAAVAPARARAASATGAATRAAAAPARPAASAPARPSAPPPPRPPGPALSRPATRAPRKPAAAADGGAGDPQLALAAHPLFPAVALKVQSATLRLPVLPRSASHALALISSPDCPPEKLARAIQADPTLTAHVLRVANSAGYAPETPVTSLELAIMRLGLNTVKDVTLTVAMKERVLSGRDADERDVMLHATLAAAFAREIAALRRADATAASLAGLLHDVGRPALRLACAEIAAELAEPVPRDVLEACIDEYHAAVGSRMVASWNLPPPIAAAVLHHHAALSVPEPHREIALCTQLADELAHWAREKDGDPAVADAIAKGPLVLALGFAAEDVERLLAARGKAVRQAESYLA